MTHWKIGDWCDCEAGRRVVVELGDGDCICVYNRATGRAHWTNSAKHLPLCDSWDWQPPSPPDPGEGYRPIDPAVDVPEEGDEICLKSSYGWHPRGNCHDPFGPHHYRRKLPTYAPFDAESFKPHRDRWIHFKSNPKVSYRATSATEHGIVLDGGLWGWVDLARAAVFDDTNTPCGVPQ